MAEKIVRDLCERMELAVGNCMDCMYYGEEDDTGRCDLDGATLAKEQLLEKKPISQECPFPFGTCGEKGEEERS